MTTAEELAALEADNESRLKDLITGKLGAAVPIPPGMFENIRIIMYLEALFDDELHLRAAQYNAAEKISDVLKNLEKQIRQAVIRSGGAPQGNVVDLATVLQLNRQIENNDAS